MGVVDFPKLLVPFLLEGEKGRLGLRALSALRILESSGVLEMSRLAISCIFSSAVCFWDMEDVINCNRLLACEIWKKGGIRICKIDKKFRTRGLNPAHQGESLVS